MPEKRTEIRTPVGIPAGSAMWARIASIEVPPPIRCVGLWSVHHRGPGALCGSQESGNYPERMPGLL